MLTFDTPGPIRAALKLAFGQALILATDRRDTTVGMYPRDPDDPADVRTAEDAHVDFTSGRLLVSVPEPRESSNTAGAVNLVVELPTGSSVQGDAIASDFRGRGTLGECRLATGLGHIRLDRTGAVHLNAALGEITVDHATGGVEATAESGDVRIRRVDGRATVRTTGDGDIDIDNVTGIARAHADTGEIHIGSAHAGVEARTTHGDIHLEEVVRGSVSASTTFGAIDIGIAEGTTAQLDLDCGAGTVYKSLSLMENPPPSEEHVHVHARTVIGDIVIRRSPTGPRLAP
ncbi:DUF4097 family beta strand repeat-containing protein [Streptomyces sp. NPDC048332]|uniref:DUF4097 family beta strand repeat-containing protein n=1 Tax=unclassified Streptomyces TaxID=2593676 RepID=UPI00343FF2E1